ncbi:nucleotidyltransferase family protein [Flavobacteriaceae bacterium]|nr:nucleotidyltransferase family protein [Flavobacteriaceae bacterium]
MNYKETLFFIAKCLTISWEEKNRQEIEKQLKSTPIDWDAVVKVSTAHYVFPALYCNFKRADFLKYLPHELINYMEHITDINRERNKQIISQAKELNNVLLANNIIPIFLKGTGNLLAGIYEDIGERMVGDIDFILSKEDYPKAITILREIGYLPQRIYNFKHFPHRHYPRLTKKNKIGAVEIHSQLLNSKYDNEFNYSFVKKDIQITNGVAVLSYANKLNLSIAASQINDDGFYYKTMALRNAYDVFLLSKKTNAKVAVNTLDKLTNPLNCFLAVCYEVFNDVDSLEYNNTKNAASYLSIYKSQFTNRDRFKSRQNRVKIYRLIKNKLNFYFKCIFYAEYRNLLLVRLKDGSWRKEKNNSVRNKKITLPNNSCLLHK